MGNSSMFSDFSKAHEIYYKNYCLENITLKYDIMAQDGELDLKGLFFKLANAEQEGEDAVMDRKKITRALKALGIDEEIKTEDVLNTMDANGDGTIDLEEWTTCMTPELRRGIYKSLSNPDKMKGFEPLVNVAKVFDQFDTDSSGSHAKRKYEHLILFDVSNCEIVQHM